MTEADTYLAQVRAALADLPPADRDDLLEDLPGHLAETLAETGSLAVLGTPQAYAAELRASAGLPAAPVLEDRPRVLAAAGRDLSAAIGRRAERARTAVLAQPYGRQLAAFLPELRPGWWVLRGYLLVALPAATGLLGFGLGAAPLVTWLGSDLLGAVLTVAAVVLSVRLGRRADALPVERRQLVAAGNLALVLLCLVAASGLRDRVGFNEQVVYAADTSYLQGPNGGISNIYAFDAQGRPLTGVQLFDQDGRPIDSLLLQSPDGAYAEPVLALDEYGVEVGNVFPRTLLAEQYGPDGPFREQVRPPAIAPRRLADTPTVTLEPSPAPATSVTVSPAASPSAAAAPSPTTAPGPSPSAGPSPR